MMEKIQPTLGASGATALLGMRRLHTPEEAARQFETILLRQFVQALTRDLFRTSLTGDEAFAWMGSYRDTQRDVLADVLAHHLAEQGRLGIAELLLRQWRQAGHLPSHNKPKADV